MNYKITRKFSFEYAHKLNLDYDSPCSNIHGHSAKVYVSLISNELNKNGMVVDFKKLSFINDFLHDTYDHTLLVCDRKSVPNNLLTRTLVLDNNPTAENIAFDITQFIIKKIKNSEEFKNIVRIKVTVFETENNSATYDQYVNFEEEDISNEPIRYPSDICLVLTKIGKEYLSLPIDENKLSEFEFMKLKLIRFCNNIMVIIPQNVDIDSIMKYINEQYFLYNNHCKQNSNNIIFKSETLYNCFFNYYLTFSIVNWEHK